ncbi:hypothetical protein F5883DRAFT_175272 [Diaporthe sp. PMI_573]|nr:hypothetical protein F5883DRAFT_175272 [Diaporthaceae sp. PMI_573]
MSRVFLMKWYHFSVKYFEDLRNINHCELLIMNKQESGKYVLENKLRTWSELRKERARKKGKEREKEKSDTGTPASKDTSKLDKALSALPATRRLFPPPPHASTYWHRCPDSYRQPPATHMRPLQHAATPSHRRPPTLGFFIAVAHQAAGSVALLPPHWPLSRLIPYILDKFTIPPVTKTSPILV